MNICHLFLNTQYIYNIQFSSLFHFLQVKIYKALKIVSNIVIYQYSLNNCYNYYNIVIEMALYLVFEYQHYFDLS